MFENVKKKQDDHAEQWLPWETVAKQHVHRKQVNKHATETRTMSVCPTSGLPSAEARTCAQLLSPCRAWLHQAGTLPEACVGRLARHLACTGGHRSHSLMFSNLLLLLRYHSIYFCLCSPTLSFASHFSRLRRRSPQVAVTGGKDDEELRSRAS